MALNWMVIYPCGDKTRLDIARVIDYEKDEWSLASLKEFNNEKEAAIYAQKLSLKTDTALTETSNSRMLHILDLEDENE